MVADAEVFDEAGHSAGGHCLTVPQGTILTLFRQALPDAGARLVNLKRAFPIQVSPSVIFWFTNDKEKAGLEKAFTPAPFARFQGGPGDPSSPTSLHKREIEGVFQESQF